MVNVLAVMKHLEVTVAFRLYLAVYRTSKPFEELQINAMLNQIVHRKSAKVQSRRTGKTDGNVWVIVFNALYFPVNSGISAYFTNTDDQTREVDRDLCSHPLVTRLNSTTYSILGVRKIILNPLTLNTAQSATFDHVLFDEVGTMRGKMEIIRQAEATTKNNRHSRISYVGTPWYDTPFKEIFDRCQADNCATNFAYTDVIGDWLDIQSIEEDRLTMPTYIWKMLYCCSWELPFGKIYTNITVVYDDFNMPAPLAYGCDQGGIDHVVGTAVINNDCYVCSEDELSFVGDRTSWNKFIGTDFELEGNWYNSDKRTRPDATAQDMADYLRTATIVSIDDEWKIMLTWFSRNFKHIYINPKRTPNLYQDLTNAQMAFGKPYYLKDQKHPCHWYEGFLHSLRPSRRYIGNDPSNINPNARNISLLIQERNRR